MLLITTSYITGCTDYKQLLLGISEISTYKSERHELSLLLKEVHWQTCKGFACNLWCVHILRELTETVFWKWSCDAGAEVTNRLHQMYA